MIRFGETFFMASLGFLGACTGAQEVRSGVEAAVADSIVVYVDPTVELISILYRLADVHPFNTQSLPSYIADIDEYFKPYRNHQAIEAVGDLDPRRSRASPASLFSPRHSRSTRPTANSIRRSTRSYPESSGASRRSYRAWKASRELGHSTWAHPPLLHWELS